MNDLKYSSEYTGANLLSSSIANKLLNARAESSCLSNELKVNSNENSKYNKKKPKTNITKANELNNMRMSQLNSTTTTTTTTTTNTSLILSSNQTSSNEVELLSNQFGQQQKKLIKTTSHNESCNKLKNLANLREVLKATHQIRNNLKSLDINKDLKDDLLAQIEASLKLNDSQQVQSSSSSPSRSILKLDKEVKPQKKQLEPILSKIESDLQESLRLLKQYNQENCDGELDGQENRKKMPNKTVNLNSIKYLKINEEDEEQKEDRISHSSFNRNDSLRKNVSQKQHVAELRSNAKEAIIKKLDFNYNKRRNSIDQIPLNNADYKKEVKETPKVKTKVKQSTSFNYEKLDELATQTPLVLDDLNREDSLSPPLLISNNNESSDAELSKANGSMTKTSSLWNYDELNDLRIKFTNLLSDSSCKTVESSPAKNSEANSPARSTEFKSTNPPTPDNQQDQLNHSPSPSPQDLINELQPIPTNELLKIESFYRSFGTALCIGGTCACLYTLNAKTTKPSCLDDIKLSQSASNRASILTTASSKTPASKEIDMEVIKDFLSSKHQNHVSVYHRGVPLWLFNSGANPRRPNRQLKFTLAEKGTGFILWQDRIDSHSDLKIYALTKTDAKLINYETFIDKMNINADLSSSKLPSRVDQANDLFSSMIITFKASDKKTVVLIKFDMNSEMVKFYDYYAQVTKRISTEIKQRTKSLPVGIGCANLSGYSGTVGSSRKPVQLRRDLAKLSANYELYFNYNAEQANRISSNLKSTSRMKRHSCYKAPCKSSKRISVHDISFPTNPKHIISVQLPDRRNFYTLSKLLPLDTQERAENKSTPSPTYSIASSSASGNTNSQLIESFNEIKEISVNEKRLSSNLESLSPLLSTLSANSSKIQASSSFSSSSSLSISPPPVITIKNRANLVYCNAERMESYEKNMRTNIEFETSQKSVLAKQRTLK